MAIEVGFCIIGGIFWAYGGSKTDSKNTRVLMPPQPAESILFAEKTKNTYVLKHGCTERCILLPKYPDLDPDPEDSKRGQLKENHAADS